MLLLAHGDDQERTQPGAATRFLSTHEKEFKSKADAKKHRNFIEMKVHTREGSAGKLRE